jgi:surfactin synthase thioesterase subunit
VITQTREPDVRHGGVPSGGPWLLDSGPGGGPSRPAMVIFPHAGGGPASYLRLARHWQAHAQPSVVCLPGHDMRITEQPVASMTDLLRVLLPAVLPVLRSRFILYGHSMGSLVAFELARQARGLFGIEPDHLVVSGFPAPRRWRPAGRHELPADQLWDSVIAMKGMPAAVAENPEARALLLPAIRADFRICETYAYRPGPPLDCPISVLAGTHDDEVRPADLMAWQDETSTVFRCLQMPGDHFLNLKSPAQFAASVLSMLGEQNHHPRSEN